MSNEINSKNEVITPKESELLTHLSLAALSKEISGENFGIFSESIQKHPEKINIWLERKSLYDELEGLKNEISFNSYIEKENITKIQQLFVQEDTNFYHLTLNQVTTKIEGYNDAGDFNYNWTGSEKVTYAEYISRLTKKPFLVREAFGGMKVDERFQNGKIFMERLLLKKPSIAIHYKSQVNEIFTDLGKGEESTWEKIKQLAQVALGDKNLDLQSNIGLAKGLRNIQDTLFSGELLYNELQEITTKTEKNSQEQLFTQKFAHYSGTVELQPHYQNLIQKRYEEIMNFLKSYDFLKYESVLQDETEQQKMKEKLIGVIALDKTIADIGVVGLGEAAEIYNEMKGLNGLLNFSDENKELSKETILFLVGMLLTSGTGVVVGLALKSRKGIQLFQGFQKIGGKVDINKIFSGEKPEMLRKKMQEYYKVIHPENKGDINRIIQAELEMANEREILEMSKGVGNYLHERGLLHISIAKNKVPQNIPQVQIPEKYASLSGMKEFLAQNYKKAGVVVLSVGSVSYLVHYVSQNEASFAPIVESVSPAQKIVTTPQKDEKNTPLPKEISGEEKKIVGPSIKHDWPKMSKKDLNIPDLSVEKENNIIDEAISYTRRKYNMNQIKLLQHVLGWKETGKLTSHFIGKIIDFQSKKGLHPDGKIGPKTLAKMGEVDAYGYQINKKSNGVGEIKSIDIPVEKGKENIIPRPHTPPSIYPPKEIQPTNVELIAKNED